MPERCIHGIDDSGERFGPVSFRLRAKQTKHLDSRQLERGATLSGGVGLGNGEGNWRLELETQLDIVPLAYIRGAQGFVTTMHDVVRGEAMRHHVLTFNKAPVSRGWSRGQLRLINPTDDSADVTITGHDDYGNPGAGAVSLSLPAGGSRTLTAHQLEGGDDDFDGSLGDGGIGRWQLFVSADRPIRVMSLMLSPNTGYMTNLSSLSAPGVRADVCVGVVDIPDVSLRAAVGEALNKPDGDPITGAELARLTELYADFYRHDRGIESLTGLECATALTKLTLLNSQISDVSPLSGLTALTELWLWGNRISDVSALSGLTALTFLGLEDNQISDVSALSGLTALKKLLLSGNQISDVSPLSGLTALTELSFGDSRGASGNQISDVSPLSGLTALTHLWLPHNQISDIGPLVSNPGLDDGDYVELSNNPLSYESRNSHIPALRARGVRVVLD